MFMRKNRSIVAATVLAVSFGLFGCSNDEEIVEEPIEPVPVDEPAPPPVEEVTAIEPIAEPISAETVYFAFDDYTLNSSAQDRLNQLAEGLKSNDNAVVQVEGHCDERGSIEYNLALGQRRAESVKNYLVQLGVDASRLTTVSYGEEKPAVVDGSGETRWSQNRRAEFTVSGQ